MNTRGVMTVGEATPLSPTLPYELQPFGMHRPSTQAGPTLEPADR
jgi:hypothetical protein